MSGGPPHHPHGRQAPAANTASAWNRLQVPNYFPGRQPQHAHMSNEHPVLHQPPTWHTPTTEPLKTIQHSHLLNLEKMLSDRQYPRHAPGVDLTLTRNGSQNGDVPTTPISLSVRDTNKINSLPASALEIQAPVLKSVSPVKSLSPGIKPVSPGVNATETGSPKSAKRSNKRVDSILERLNPNPDKISVETAVTAQPDKQSVIVQAAGSSHDENSNSSSTLNVPTPTNTRDDYDVVSPFSNDDSLDSNKSRRKRKPSKTMRVAKDDKPTTESELLKNLPEEEVVSVTNKETLLEEKKIPERRRSSDDLNVGSNLPKKSRRKTSSESETIANIAAMVHEGLKDDKNDEQQLTETKPVSVSVIKTHETANESQKTPPQTENEKNEKIDTQSNFVEVENKLEQMFAGIEDSSCDSMKDDLDDLQNEDSLLKLAEAVPSVSHVTSTSNDVTEMEKSPQKNKKKSKTNSRRSSESLESTPKKKKLSKKKSLKNAGKMSKSKVKVRNMKIESVKDVYAYDSNSNASSSKSRGPFIHIRGPRDSPISVNVINTPQNDEDGEKKLNKPKKFHDDSEYRHKVRSKGLHCSTLSNKYDAQTRDTSWICAFCKKGPHATDQNGLIAPGDLFGPYIITTTCPEYERRLNDPYDKQFKSKKISTILDAKITCKKSKRKHSDGQRSSIDSSDCNENYNGMIDTGSNSFEVWAHEDCIVWSPGVYLIGPKIIGLEEAVWSSCNVICNKCHLKGANVCCLKRGCPNVVHVDCARISNWQLEETTYRSFCPAHKKEVI